MRRREKKNNKGFSLVELIVVIAIMIVLVAVLAPVLSKYVEQSRRATDVQNANTIAEAILIEVADNSSYADKLSTTPAELKKGESDDGNVPSAIAEVPDVKGKLYTDGKFFVSYDSSKNKASVYIGTAADKLTGDLTTETAAEAYKTGK